MKKYKVNYAEKVNAKAAKTGIKWTYGGKVANYEEVVERYHKFNSFSRVVIGIRITDTDTDTVIYEELKEGGAQ